ncbi:hypothetical protein GP486_005239 [Trichoglossum hirsutum]|uniref:Uncharacterized protein n=1 Tax=Trichoglossum hirsutum TaxID=265104 RepID=A0A9P8RMM9_9PEZI|nr:hypothetical protein GP486_005239 [Trichoglossum hirsutum]
METHIWMQWLLEPVILPEEQVELQTVDIYSKWFGTVGHRVGVPSLLVWPRLSQLVNKYPPTTTPQAIGRCPSPTTLEVRGRQYPSLVSFFGDTGGGKSTLIKTLIRNRNFSKYWDAPVPGDRADSHYSTSGDVHSYIDPSSASGEAPMFYADCEGLRGSSITALKKLAARSYEPNDSRHPSRSFGQSLRTREPPEERLKRTLREHQEKATHDLRLIWAVKHAGPLQEDPSSRQYIVKHLFPRFLYTFSDVVCYVTENARTTEQEIEDLIGWASMGHRMTVNQRIKPSLIIVTNKDTRPGATEWCDVDYATGKQIDKLNIAFDRFSRLRDKWMERGKELKSTKDLILCYYDSFRVICIPSLVAVPSGIIARQYEKLYAEIQLASQTIRTKRQDRGMKLDIESFSFYTQHAFELFSKNLGHTFDFRNVGGRLASIPEDFSDHLVNLLVRLKDRQESPAETTVGQEVATLKKFIPFLASCLALEYVEKHGGP